MRRREAGGGLPRSGNGGRYLAVVASALLGCNVIIGIDRPVHEAAAENGEQEQCDGGACPTTTPCDDPSGCGGAQGAGGAGGSGAGEPLGIAFAEAEPTPQAGNVNGGGAADDACPEGQVLIGFSGFYRVDGYHGQIQGLCGAPHLVPGDPYSIVVDPGDTLPLRGAIGSEAWTQDCPVDEVVIGFDARSGALVDQLAIRCAPLLVTGSPGTYALSRGPVSEQIPVGGETGQPFPTTDCPEPQIADVSRLRAGDSIDAFGLGCATPTLVY